ncbi:MAG: 50S ribosomal protein L32 [Candidatus Riflebacteria bacterium]|nr:50S ribosomal protein L32 [Candidatus Riflebacteria bacterium]
MAACPKHRVSRMNQRKRRTHYKVGALTLAKCQQCFELKLAHRVCPKCGYYSRKIKVLDIKQKEK